MHLERSSRDLEQPRRELVQVLQDRLEPVVTREQDRELVAREAPCVRVLGQLGEHAPREDLEARVAGRMPERVVDVLEAVDVEVEDRDVLLGAASARNPLLEQVLELHTVRDFSERVRPREIANPLLDALALVDVVRGVDLALVAAVAVHLGDRVRDADRRAVGAQHRAFTRPRRDAVRATPVARDDQLVGELTDELRFGTAEKLAGRRVRALDPVLGVGDQQRLADACQQPIEIVTRHGARAQADPNRVHRVR